MTYTFTNNERLGIKLPLLEQSWNNYTKETQESILAEWETIRGKIPDRIKDLENEINDRQSQLYQEEDFERSCKLNSEISELASIINDLWIWYRTNNHITSKVPY
ncbi:hypothetical protein [Pseudalkalibacillus salsuginis]|uniref:hypothetical protein n=1 Tax=Pseudalkalibacillus salsuginis TaxID=2910972 RepID=UPI001F2D6CBF|nr:hypothetical protein [Pseudalkalibacillus salsuginis]MCF6408767.1 hypothetical protein [Pseudalkalibacillus salsuginis]